LNSHFAKIVFTASLLFAFLSASNTLAASDALVLKDKWFQCKKNTSCRWTTEPCNRPAAVNKWHKKKYARYVAKQRTMIRCTAPPDESYMLESKKHVACIENKCVVDFPSFVR
jgi:hypothetical protein